MDAQYLDYCHSVSRHPDWSYVARMYMIDEPNCRVCGKKGEAVHHILPVHLRPDLELDRNNMATVCHRCHLFVGHLDNWLSWNVSFNFDASRIRNNVHMRPCSSLPS